MKHNLTTRARIASVRLIRERAGVISDKAVWILIARPYMYGPCPTLSGLFWETLRGWRSDRNLVG